MAEQNNESVAASDSKPFSEEHNVNKKGAAIALVWIAASVLSIMIAIRGGVLK